jgi:enoyl-CoA hydratase/carnithine racemase
MTTTADSMLSCSVDGAVATLVINRPPANALTPDLLAELSRAFGHCAEDDAVKAVVLTGTGRFFIAGADIRLWRRLPRRRKAKRSRSKDRPSCTDRHLGEAGHRGDQWCLPRGRSGTRHVLPHSPRG